jgi:hypothetical protein
MNHSSAGAFYGSDQLSFIDGLLEDRGKLHCGALDPSSSCLVAIPRWVDQINDIHLIYQHKALLCK